MDGVTRLTKQIQAANKVNKADLVIKNGNVVNVFTLEVEKTDVAVCDGMIVGTGTYEGEKEVDAEGKYVVPGLIDGHVHIESSMVSPVHFADAVVPHGVTTVITDPHEIANVAGKAGIQFMLDNSEGLGLDILFMLPSCVPATPFENAGAELTAEDLVSFYEHPRVLGLAEVMDYPSTAGAVDGMVRKLADAKGLGKIIDGHGAGLNSHAMNIYGTAGITTDHESTTEDEALDRLRKGLYVIIREGSGAKDLGALISLVNHTNARRFLFCTDDKHLDELMEYGSIDHNIRLAVQQGMDPLQAVQLATMNAAECYGLKTKGAVAPGFEADFLLVDDLKTFTISSVYKNGVLAARDGMAITEKPSVDGPNADLLKTVTIPDLDRASFKVPADGSDKAHAIKLIPNSLVTEKKVVNPDITDGMFLPSVSRDIMKIAVIERHKATGNIGLGFIQGLGFSEGAVALTVAHDSHNLVTAGTNDEDMLTAVNEAAKMGGGIVLVKNRRVISALPLNIAGLMSSGTIDETYEKVKGLDEGLEELGFNGQFNPFSALSFMCLPVIPALKLTDLGYFDCKAGRHIPVNAE